MREQKLGGVNGYDTNKGLKIFARKGEKV